MLTAEEQGKILQDEDKRLGRDWKKRMTTLQQQLKMMGGFGQDPDSEQALTEEIMTEDTRPPLQYLQDSNSKCELSFAGSSFWEFRKQLFHAWLFQARLPSSWIKEKDLPLCYRFALRRPIMDERTFWSIMQGMSLQLDTSAGNARQPYTRPRGRSRRMMLGIDLGLENIHPSNKLRNVLPRGKAEDKGEATEENPVMSIEDDEDMHELVHRQLWTVYEHVQDGSVQFEKAAWNYRDALNDQNMSDKTLVQCLEQYGVPTHHILTNKRKTRRVPPRKPTLSAAQWCENSVEMRAIITELTNYVGLYHSNSLSIDEVVPMIHDCLIGLTTLEADFIGDILTSPDLDEETAALLIWEAANEDSDASSSSSSSEGEQEESNKTQGRPLRAVLVPDPHVSEKQDYNSPATLPVNESKFHGGSMTKDMDYQDGSKENEPNQSRESSIDRPITIPRATLPAKLPTCGFVDELESRIMPPPAPKPKPTFVTHATETTKSHVSQNLDGEPPLDPAIAWRRRPSSPEQGMTIGIWGILMPVRKAREIAHAMKLTQSTIDDQVRPISPPRTGRRAEHAKTVITFPKAKRKASIALDKDSPPKSPKHGNNLDLFAKEDEDSETFVLSHFGPDEIKPTPPCMKCLCRPCECEDELSESSTITIKPRCSECLQQPCVCSHIPKLDQATQAAPPTKNLSYHDFKITLLAYLARWLDDDDVLASLRQLERLPSADDTITDIKWILALLMQRSYYGRKIDTPGDEPSDDDREAVRILKSIVSSSAVLTHFVIGFLCEVEKNTSAKGLESCHDRMGEGSDLGSSLLNNGAEHGSVPAPSSDPGASVAIFLDTQLSVANDRFMQALKKPLAKDDSLYSPAPAPILNVTHLEPCSKSQDASQPSPQKFTHPDSSAASDSSRTESHSGPQRGGELSTAGGLPPIAEHSSESPARSPQVSTTELSKQVGHHDEATEDETANSFGYPLTRHPRSSPKAMATSDGEERPPPTPRLSASELPQKGKLKLICNGSLSLPNSGKKQMSD